MVAELFGQVTTDPFDVDYYIGSVSKTNDTAEGEAAYQAVLWLQNQGDHHPAVIVSDLERGIDGNPAPTLQHGVACYATGALSFPRFLSASAPTIASYGVVSSRNHRITEDYERSSSHGMLVRRTREELLSQ